MSIKKRFAAVAMSAALLTAAGCGGGSDVDKPAADGPVTMTFWHNSTTGEGKQYWEDTAAAFMKENPKVKIEIQAIQNEDLDGKLQNAMNAGTPPTAFMARGGGKLGDMVEADQVMDLTDKLTDETKKAYGDAIFSAFSIENKVYGMPTSVLPVGIYYSKDLFAKAGIAKTPTTMDELVEAANKLKAAGVQPIALGAKDAWPAAQWYYQFALRHCSKDVLTVKAMNGDFEDGCWLKAGEEMKKFADAKPFNEGFLTTSAQQGAGSSAGMIANHKAGMELMGAWNNGVIAGLTPDQKPLKDLGWFPMPTIEGGAGDPTALMGGSDGFACAKSAPAACVDWLNFFAKKEHQEGYGKALHTLPANKDAQSVVTDEVGKSNLEAYNKAGYVVTFLDTLYGQNVGNALNGGVVNMLAGKGGPQDIVDATKAAAKKG